MSIATALEQVGGLQTQASASGYVGLWSRLVGFERDSLTEELERRQVVQATLMRTTIHMVSARDYPFLAEAVRAPRRDWYLRVNGGRIAAAEVEAAAARARQLLADGPRKREELVKLLGINNQAWYGVGLWLDLVRVPPSGTWAHKPADLYLTADAWLGPSRVKAGAGLKRLITLYLSGFGPARAKNIADWGGLPMALVTTVVAEMRLARYRDESGAELLDLPGAPLPDPETPAPVRFLPTWDATLLVHARRTQVLPEEHRNKVFDTKTPHSVGTFLVDGAVAGKWRLERNRVVVEAFVPLPRAVKRQVDEEAERLTAFHA